MNFFQKKFFNKKNTPKRVISVLVLICLITLVGFIFGSFITDKEGMVALVLSKVLVKYTNEDRSIKNLGELKVNPLLEKAAELKARDMIDNNYFAHQSPDGHSPWYWLDQVGYNFSYAGENLAVNFTESEDVNQAWLNSPKHKENIMNGNFTEIGIATVDGMYKGKLTTFVVQFFGKPSKIALAKKDTNTNTSMVKTTLATSTKPKLSTIATSTVLGASGENITYVGVENYTIIEQEKNNPSFWQHFITWFLK